MRNEWAAFEPPPTNRQPVLPLRAPNSALRTLFVSQCHDRIQARRPAGRPDAEEQPYRGAEHEGEEDGERGNQRIPVREARQYDGASRAEYHADHAAQQAQHQRFDQELEHDVEPRGPERFADADLARALGDRHEHDVHDPDAPTSRLTAAIPASRYLKVSVVCCSVAR